MVQNHRFGPARRIKRRPEFLHIQSQGQKFRSKFFVLALSLLSSKGSISRLGITVTTKVNKRAVARNRLKRRVRELYRRNRFGLRPAADTVVIAQQGATELDFEQIAEELEYLARKANRFFRANPSEPQEQR